MGHIINSLNLNLEPITSYVLSLSSENIAPISLHPVGAGFFSLCFAVNFGTLLLFQDIGTGNLSSFECPPSPSYDTFRSDFGGSFSSKLILTGSFLWNILRSLFWLFEGTL